jgi:CarD family transcriptional regulator
MEYQIGEWVVHFKHGLGQVVGMEERVLNGGGSMYYVVQTPDLTIWVPMDEHVQARLRMPVSAAGFKNVISILSEPAEELPTDYRQRNLKIQTMLKQGDAEARCRVIRDLAAYRHGKTWNVHDQEVLKAVRKVLIGEWCYSLAISPEEAEMQLTRSLTHKLD